MDAITRHALKIPRYYLSKHFPRWFELHGEVFKWSKFISNLMTYFLRKIYIKFDYITRFQLKYMQLLLTFTLSKNGL